jgi:hypothetical protein
VKSGTKYTIQKVDLGDAAFDAEIKVKDFTYSALAGTGTIKNGKFKVTSYSTDCAAPTVTTEQNVSTKFTWRSAGGAKEFTLPKLEVATTKCRPFMTYVATFHADILSEITDSLNADTNTYVPKFTVKAHTATGNLRKTLTNKYVIKTAKGDSKNETSFTIYVEDPKCDNATGVMLKGDTSYTMKQVLAGSDKTQILDAWLI